MNQSQPVMCGGGKGSAHELPIGTSLHVEAVQKDVGNRRIDSERRTIARPRDGPTVIELPKKKIHCD